MFFAYSGNAAREQQASHNAAIANLINVLCLCVICREKDGQLYELDGRKEFPINHGETTPDSLLVVRGKSPLDRCRHSRCRGFDKKMCYADMQTGS